MNKNNSFFFKFIVIILLIIIIFLISDLKSTDFNSNAFHTEKYTVISGDTLWIIGRKCVGDNVDVREWIEAVKNINNISSNIYPGQIITVYIYNG